ncbi:hypothetical protein [Pseudorhizobium flavum]|uniref:Uncharacterized protein n=1 Tax=Pseudorhizobium flavum TaxID=1335061 RepID=A0A7W9YUD7_9HYPH|nr:hypothetical protein [Pseudorhizobium flavum]MBB6178455.1 hypothetical protein [Pseudorhizobium flavum]
MGQVIVAALMERHVGGSASSQCPYFGHRGFLNDGKPNSSKYFRRQVQNAPFIEPALAISVP